MTKENVYIIIPVHNRKVITLKCLATLEDNGDLAKYYVIVVDDGSTDGTSEAIKSLYSEVIILEGDGNLWWTGAVKKGMEYAYKNGAEYLIWLNDDCYPQKETIPKLIKTCRTDKQIVAGAQSLDPETFQPSYAGIIVRRNQIVQIHTLKGLLECDGLSGNLVCLHRNLIKDIEYPNFKLFPQYYGDVTYTHQAKKNNYRLLIQGDAIAFCKNDHPNISWLNPNKSLLSYWQDYFKIGSPQYWKAELNYYGEMFGFRGFALYLYQKIIRFWIFFVIIKFIPSSWRQYLKKLKHELKHDSSCL
ncbi:MAG: glycosyltransferase family 2 protein [Pseudanabaena sp. M051S1SP1A06QC]|jgi:GT2 family glycosyltransferase|uniref:glycosyltransferase family 2 protein n=1 Tax=Pseudanabaena mucicola TaxID=71190 RepID=UPI002576611B|nr:glycosyltransferase family 2 protein [Pseudanabaena mucicola]MCA6586909.1 glycosyltransferase family 2 protein [Pseudanabaena sp. M051S1SP1A06QC]MCA6596202.1 glycosyltransferase family 2 protein [Pseudanabaena sp. M046S1SP1A06QC]